MAFSNESVCKARRRAAAVVLFAVGSTWAHAQDTAQAQHDADALAKQLANPVAALISVPFQFNYDSNIGPDDDGHRTTMNIQPVIPMSISHDWNLISRTILPIIDQQDVAPGAGSQSGTGDITQSFFFSPKAPTSGGLIWGVGPALLLPTASDELLGSDKWGIGPTGVVLKQDGPWTVGALANHIWSVAGDDDRADISSTFLQPFLTYAVKGGWTYVLQAESSYDWKGEEWNVPIGAFVGKVTKIGGQLMQFTGGPRYYADHTDNGPKGWGFRFAVVLMFPE